ncbi:MAG: hypothetical protein KKA42_16365 [candidate division Zixibacteria bacterium]|nr:hypothetical protein [candidate division Zixibacteria bacterium]
MSTAASDKQPQRGRTVSYLVSTYGDLRDVVFAVEKMMQDGSETRNKALLREHCRMTIHPLEDKSSYIVRIQLHPSIFIQ